MKLYAIKHIPSGGYLPPGGKGKDGHAHQDPSSTRAPRLFVKESDARQAMRCYVSGKWVVTFYGEEDLGGPEPKYCGRVATEYEVVPMTLREDETMTDEDILF